MTFSFKKTRSLIAIGTVGLALTLAGCGSDGTDRSDLRVLHTSKDAPPVNVNVDSKTVIGNLDYAGSSGFVSVRSGTKNIRVEGIIPGGNADVISVDNFAFEKNERYTILAINDVAAIDALIVEESATEPTSSEVAVVVVHASTNAGEVDVYVTAPGVDVAAASPAFTFNQGDVIDAGALAATSYRIQVTGTGSKTVVYDSGTVDLSGFAGDKLILAAISSTTETELATSPVKLLAANDSAHLVIPDTNTQAGARVLHLSPDAGTAAMGPVEVFATTDGVSVELIPAFEYTDVVPDQTADKYVAVAPGDYVFAIAVDGAGIGAAVYTSPSITLESGSEYTTIAAGLVTNTADPLELLATVDENRPVATQASVKVVHGAPAAGTVDVYVTPSSPKFTTADVESGAAGDPLLADFEFGTITDYVALAPGMYDIRVVAGGTTAINVEDFELTGGQVATIIASQADGVGSPAPFSVVVLTN